MGILNYTSKVEAVVTMGEIQGILGKGGAHAISMEYAGGEPVAIYFAMEVSKQMLNFRLPGNWENVLAAMKRDRTVEPRYRNEAQAKRTAWRIIKDWIEAQMAIVECGQAEMAEVFMPYAVLANGSTLYKHITENPKLLLT